MYEKEKTITFNPPAISTLTTNQIKKEQENPSGLRTGIIGFDSEIDGDKKFKRMRPEKFIPVLGAQSNFKTGFMLAIADNVVEQIDKEKDVVVYVTWEQSVEEQGMLDLSRISKISAASMYDGNISATEWDRILSASIERAETPLWMLGHAGGGSGGRRPRLTVTDVENALAYIQDYQGKKIRFVVLDYIQRINREDKKRDGGTREQFMAVVDHCKDLGLMFKAPCMVGSQVKRDVATREWKQPRIDDGQETSNLEHTADQMITLWMPKTTEPLGSILEYGGESIMVTPYTLLAWVAKQKFGEAPLLFKYDVIPQYNKIVRYGTAPAVLKEMLK